MMRVGFISVKGGQGCSVSAAVFGLAAAGWGCRVLLVDQNFAGQQDLAAVFGVSEPCGNDVVEVADRVFLSVDPYVVTDGFDVVVDDWGLVSGPVPVNDSIQVLVTESSYLAAKRAVVHRDWYDHVLVVHEASNALSPDDIFATLGVGSDGRMVVIRDPGVARAVDAGLLAYRGVPASYRTVFDWLLGYRKVS
jgi:hypothetical protein